MLGPGTYHYVTWGRRYVRDVESGIVGNQALAAARDLKERAARAGHHKAIGVQTIVVTEEQV